MTGMVVSRRGAGSGSITSRGENHWRVQVDLGRDPSTGKRLRRRFSVAGSKKAAEQKLREVLTQRDHGVDLAPEKITVAEYLDRWLRDYAESNVAPSTLRRYRQLAIRLQEELGLVRLQQLRPAQIQAVYRRLELGDGSHRPLAKRTVGHHHRVLREALHHAVRWQLLVANPADAVTPPRPVARELRTLSAVDVRALLDAIEDVDLRAFALVAVQTGARLGELLALRWGDLDLPAARLSIRRSLDYYTISAGPSFGEPKTARGRRNIALSMTTITALREHRARQLEAKLRAGPAWVDQDLVFPNALGAPAPKYDVSQRFIRIARNAGFTGLRFHDLRHTAATLMLEAGIHPKVVSERLGHSTIAITLDTYSHVLPHMQAEAAETLDAALQLG